MAYEFFTASATGCSVSALMGPGNGSYGAADENSFPEGALQKE